MNIGSFPIVRALVDSWREAWEEAGKQVSAPDFNSARTVRAPRIPSAKERERQQVSASLTRWRAEEERKHANVARWVGESVRGQTQEEWDTLLGNGKKWQRHV